MSNCAGERASHDGHILAIATDAGGMGLSELRFALNGLVLGG